MLPLRNHYNLPDEIIATFANRDLVVGVFLNLRDDLLYVDWQIYLLLLLEFPFFVEDVLAWGVFEADYAG